MGFGLHIGWAIEGAIGSDFKIDASYLSPNVNIASRLEAATKQYGTQLLLSGQLWNCCSSSFKKYFRRVDIVTVKGSIRPIILYTVDIDINELPASKEPLNIAKENQLEVEGLKKDYIWNLIETGIFDTEILLKT